MLTYPFQGVPTVVNANWELVLRAQPAYSQPTGPLHWFSLTSSIWATQGVGLARH